MGKMTIIAQRAQVPGNLADEYLALKAKIADLKVKEKALQDAIVATGKDVIEGTFGRVTVSEIEDRWEIDYRAAAVDRLGPKILARYRKFVAGTTRFNVRARKGEEVKAA
jgi:hypothetical protein